MELTWAQLQVYKYVGLLQLLSPITDAWAPTCHHFLPPLARPALLLSPATRFARPAPPSPPSSLRRSLATPWPIRRSSVLRIRPSSLFIPFESLARAVGPWRRRLGASTWNPRAANTTIRWLPREPKLREAMEEEHHRPILRGPAR